MSTKPVTRTTGATVFERSKHREVVVTVHSSGVLEFRLKQTRRSFSLTADVCYQLAVKASLQSDKKKRRLV